jgi:hypothetical protein
MRRRNVGNTADDIDGFGELVIAGADYRELVHGESLLELQNGAECEVIPDAGLEVARGDFS